VANENANPAKEPLPGASATATRVVGDADLASPLSEEHSDVFPPVYATARMVALMELAASRVLVPLLGDGEMSVGVFLDVKHTAATPPGAKVTARAVYRGREGKFYRFDVEARDPGGPIGSAVHDRAIVSVARLVEGAKRRVG
jgi:fluoroacetyl-CoA thioesterase